MKLLITIYVLFLAACAMNVSAADKPGEIKMAFAYTNTKYEVKAVFLCRAQNMDTLKSLIYDYNHVRKYERKAYSIVMLRTGKNWHELLYRYKGPMWTINTTFERRLDNERNLITFKMTRFSKTGKLPLPEVLSSSGYYRLSAKGSFYQVEYYQTATTGPFITPQLYFNEVKKGCASCLQDLRNYISAQNGAEK
ncbi:MAG: hypothetical protein WC071_04065 [Victivallaceae bacterium]